MEIINQSYGKDISAFVAGTGTGGTLMGIQNGFKNLGKDTKIHEQHHESISFSIDDFQKGQREQFNKLSEGIRKMILRSKELDGIDTSDLGDEGNGNDLGKVPF